MLFWNVSDRPISGVTSCKWRYKFGDGFPIVAFTLGFATPHLCWVLKPKYSRRVVFADNQNPITFRIMAEMTRVLLGDYVELRIVEICDCTARPGRERNQSTIGG
jgi:hypothetical protein